MVRIQNAIAKLYIECRIGRFEALAINQSRNFVSESLWIENTSKVVSFIFSFDFSSSFF